MKIIDLITKDVTDENDIGRNMIVLRILYIIVFVAFLVDIILAGGDAIRMFPYKIFGLLAANVILFLLTYEMRSSMALILFITYLFTWTLSMIPGLGWSAGMQNYFIIVLMLCFFSTHGKLRYKFFLSAFVLVMRIVTISIFGGVKSVANVSPFNDKLLQITNITAVFVSIVFISYIYSRDTNLAEDKLMKYNDKLKKEANTDQLTGLYNRRRAEEYLQELKATGFNDSISIAMGDIDFFKKVNDTYGHDAGDEVLKTVANTMKEIAGTYSFISRWGGEEFLLIFKGINGDDALIILEKLRRIIQNRVINVNGQEIKITMTFGLTEYNIRKEPDGAIKEADEKLYLGKSKGRNQVVY